MLEHGGRLARAAAHYGIPRDRWLDLSTGVSPHAWPAPAIPAEAWHRLPEDEDDLLDAARAYYGCEHLLPVAGTQAAIQALPRLRARSRIGVLAPGYAEHAHAWREAGHDVTLLPMEALVARAGEFDVVVFISPNNPTGERLPDAFWQLRSRASALLRKPDWMVVDEAFGDSRLDAFLQPRDGMILLRSIGKFFGMAGARAGFVAAWPALLDALREQLGPWALSGPTRYVVARALRDTVWQDAMRRRLKQESTWLASTLEHAGLKPAGGTDLFQYCPHPDAAGVFEALARRGVLVRLFNEPSALRFGLPPDDVSHGYLASALAEILP
jgi:cobalamin biosynthetic protein CobC